MSAACDLSGAAPPPPSDRSDRAHCPHDPDRPQQRPRRVLRALAARRRRRRAGAWSPAPTSPAASTPVTRRPARTCALAAAARACVVGAQVGYRDLAGFGRRFIDVDPAELDRRRDLPDRRPGRRSPGRPGTRCATSSRTARSTTRSCTTRGRRRRSSTPSLAYDRDLPVLGLPGLAAAGAAAASRAAHGPRGVRRPRLHPRGRRSSRDGEPGARARPTPTRSPRAWCAWSRTGTLDAVDGSRVAVDAESVCVHGDSPGRSRWRGRCAPRWRPAGRRRCSRSHDATRGAAPYGDRALLVELGRTDAGASRWTDALRRAEGCPGCVDLVPAAETLLVVATRRADVGRRCAAAARLAARRPRPAAAGRAERGRDPGALRRPRPRRRRAAHRAVPSGEVVAAHTGRPGGSPSAGSPPASPTSSAATARLARAAPRRRRGPRVPAGVGRAGRRVQRGLPARVARRLAADRHAPTCADVGPRPGPAGAAAARARGPVRARPDVSADAAACAPPGRCASSRTSAGRVVRPSGVGRSGAADRAALRQGNRAGRQPRGRRRAGGDPRRPEVEVRRRARPWLCVTGAPAPVSRRRARTVGPTRSSLRAGRVASYGSGRRRRGLRSYLAVRGGLDVPPVLGSRSHDVMAGLGPAAARARATSSRSAAPPRAPAPTSTALPPARLDEDVVLPCGPRSARRLGRATSTALVRDRRGRPPSGATGSGMRLAGGGARAPRRRAAAAQRGGLPRGGAGAAERASRCVFLADHPVTGGYPVVAVVVDADVDRAAQVRPGQRVRFRWVAAP